jgi:hypothetical protein
MGRKVTRAPETQSTFLKHSGSERKSLSQNRAIDQFSDAGAISMKFQLDADQVERARSVHNCCATLAGQFAIGAKLKLRGPFEEHSELCRQTRLKERRLR